jgi:hypothetical protein
MKLAVLKKKSSIRYLIENPAKSLCQLPDSDDFSFFNLLHFCSPGASFSDDLGTAEPLNRSRP